MEYRLIHTGDEYAFVASEQMRVPQAEAELALVNEFRNIDWPAEARKAAMMLWASGEFSANDSLSNAEVLIAEMKRREAFGGATSEGSTR